MSELDDFNLIGEIRNPEDIQRYADALQPRYERERWTWGGVISKPYIPSTEQIAETIRELQDSRGESPWISTGGLALALEDGREVLYADERLGTGGTK